METERGLAKKKKFKLDPRAHHRLIKFYIIDLIGFGLNILIYIYGTRKLNLSYPVAILLGTAVIILITYYGGRLWTFHETEVGHAEGLGKHIVIDLIMMGVVIAGTAFFIELFTIHDIAARVLASIVAATLSFVLSSYITFEIPIFHRHHEG